MNEANVGLLALAHQLAPYYCTNPKVAAMAVERSVACGYADRVTSPWLIRRFVDPQAEFVFVPKDQVIAAAEREGATPFDVQGVELGHHGKECTFEAILKQYNLRGDPALVLLGKVVNGADTDNTLWDWAMTRRYWLGSSSSATRSTAIARPWSSTASPTARSKPNLPFRSRALV
jgi:hypothetical protein